MAIVDKAGIAWITGASSGIGKALALELCRRGWTVIASARNEAALSQAAAEAAGAGRFVPMPVDVTDPEAVSKTYRRIVERHGEIDLAILNAGTHVPTPAGSFDRDVVAGLIDTNLMGTVNVLSVLMPAFAHRRSGEIAVVASMTGYRGLPTAAAYGATKAALINMCEALRPELELHNVSLRLVNPGFVDTPLTRKNPFPMPFLVSADKAAKQIVKGLRSRRFEITVPRRMALVMKTLRLVPNWLFLTVARRITPAPVAGPEAQAPSAVSDGR